MHDVAEMNLAAIGRMLFFDHYQVCHAANFCHGCLWALQLRCVSQSVQGVVLQRNVYESHPPPALSDLYFRL